MNLFPDVDGCPWEQAVVISCVFALRTTLKRVWRASDGVGLSTTCLAVGYVTNVVAVHEVFDVLWHDLIKRIYLRGVILHNIVELVNRLFLLGILVTNQDLVFLDTLEFLGP